MIITEIRPEAADFPDILRKIDSPPKQLFHQGAPLAELLSRPTVAIVGSRNISAYGKQVTRQLARELAEQGVVIISGLAIGVDGLAHKAALDADGLAIAVLPTPLDDIYPRTNRPLAERILANGGALISEYRNSTYMYKTNFVARNRLVSGLAKILLITEAAKGSGSLHTAKFALEQGKEVMVVPGNIDSPGSVGTNSLLKQGATPVTSSQDIMNVLGLIGHKTKPKAVHGHNPEEQSVLDLLVRGVHAGEELLEKSGLSTSEFNQTITMLEITGKIRPLGGNQWALY